MSRCEEGSESSNEKDELPMQTTEDMDPKSSARNVRLGHDCHRCNVEATKIALMMNEDGSIDDLFTQFSWSPVFAVTTECDCAVAEVEYEQRQTLRNRIRNTPLHIAMERYYNECPV